MLIPDGFSTLNLIQKIPGLDIIFMLVSLWVIYKFVGYLQENKQQ